MNKFKLLCTSMLLGCSMAMSAQAAETKAEYREAAAPIRAELSTAHESLQSLITDNKASAAAYKDAVKTKKETGTAPVDQETWNQIKELRQQIKDIRKGMDKPTIKELRQNAKSAAADESYDTAIDYLEEALDLKEDRLDEISRIHELWQQIDSLLAK